MPCLKTVSLIGGLLAALGVLPTAAYAAPREVAVEGGVLVGETDGAIASFKGVPFAAPPVGPLRWRPPSPAPTWFGARDARQFGHDCPQERRPDSPNPTVDENCLVLNVWAPASAKGAPVMVWFHGGEFISGSGARAVHYGAAFARDGVVIVTVNYRLGALGFFAHPALTNEAGPDAPLGNYGLMDQVAALQWVQRNIAAFGGDPKAVTIAGQSAGGSSVLALLATPAARPLYRQAIVQSAGQWVLPDGLAEHEAQGAALVTAAGVSTVEASPERLRAMPWSALVRPSQAGTFVPFADGRWLKRDIDHLIAAGALADVPLLIGTNSDEGSLAQRGMAEAAGMILARFSPSDRDRIHAAYGEEGRDEAIYRRQLFADTIFTAPARFIAGRTGSGAPTYLYRFSYLNSSSRGRAPGAAHGWEVAEVFDTLHSVRGLKLTPEDVAMATTMHACWKAFIKTGQPACDRAPAWPAYTPTADALMEFGLDGPKVVSGLRKPQLDALEAWAAPILSK